MPVVLKTLKLRVNGFLPTKDPTGVQNFPWRQKILNRSMNFQKKFLFVQR